MLPAVVVKTAGFCRSQLVSTQRSTLMMTDFDSFQSIPVCILHVPDCRESVDEITPNSIGS